MQTYDTPADFRDTIVAARGEPPEDVPDDVPVLLDLAYGSLPGAEALREHWERAARVRRPVVLAGSLHPGNVAAADRRASARGRWTRRAASRRRPA